MHKEITGFDPTADRAGDDVEPLRHIGDREEPALIAVKTAMNRWVTSRSYFCYVDTECAGCFAMRWQIYVDHRVASPFQLGMRNHAV